MIPGRSATSCETASCTGRLSPRVACSPPVWLASRSKYRLLSEVFRHSYPPAARRIIGGICSSKIRRRGVGLFGRPIYFHDLFWRYPKNGHAQRVFRRSSNGSKAGAAWYAVPFVLTKPNEMAMPSLAAEGSSSNLKHGDLHVTDALPSLGSFKEGMGTLVECLAKKLGDDLRFGVKVKSRRVAKWLGTKESQAGGYACPAAMKSMPTQSSWPAQHMRLYRCSMKACRSCPRCSRQSNTHRWTWCHQPSTGNKFVIRWMVLDSWFLGEKDCTQFARSGIHRYSHRRLRPER